MFTPNQIEQLVGVINLQHVIFIATNIGPEMLSDTELQLLTDAGVDIESLGMTPFEQMFRWGMLSMSIGEDKSKAMKPKDFQNFLRRGSYLPLTPVEKAAKKIAQSQAANDIRGLGNKISSVTGQLIIEGDQAQRANYEKVIREETVKNIENRGSITNLVSNLGHRTGDWSRDFGRIADYVTTQAFEEGRASQISSQHGEDSMVYKKVFQTACKSCVKLYLTDGTGSEPRLFKLSQLKKNGTNIGRQVSDWKPVIGPTHPWCRCMLVYVDPNYDWDPVSQSYNRPKDYQRVVQRNSRVRVTIGDKTITV